MPINLNNLITVAETTDFHFEKLYKQHHMLQRMGRDSLIVSLNTETIRDIDNYSQSVKANIQTYKALAGLASDISIQNPEIKSLARKIQNNTANIEKLIEKTESLIPSLLSKL